MHGQDAGRSINLALSVRGLHALREIGLADDVVKSSILMRGRMIHGRDGSLAFQPYGKDDSEALHSVSRAGLNLLLVEAAARYPTVRMHFAHRCTGLDLATGQLEFQAEQRDPSPVQSEFHSRRRRGLLRRARGDAAAGAVRLFAGLPHARLQGIDDPARRRAARSAWSRTRCTSGRGAAS